MAGELFDVYSKLSWPREEAFDCNEATKNLEYCEFGFIFYDSSYTFPLVFLIFLQHIHCNSQGTSWWKESLRFATILWLFSFSLPHHLQLLPEANMWSLEWPWRGRFYPNCSNHPSSWLFNN